MKYPKDAQGNDHLASKQRIPQSFLAWERKTIGEEMFFKRIFRKPLPKEPPTEKLNLGALQRRVDDLRKKKIESAGPTIQALLDETNAIRKLLLNHLGRLSEAGPSEDVYTGLLRTGTEAKKLLIGKITRALAEISQAPELNPLALEAFDMKLTRAVNLTTDAFGVHGRYVEAIFRPELTDVRSDLRRLHEVAERVHDAIKNILEENTKLGSLSSEIDFCMQLVESVKKAQSEIKLLEERHKNVEETLRGERERLVQLRSSDEFKRAAEMEEGFRRAKLRIKRAEDEVAGAFLSISRALRKFEKLISSGEYQLDREKAEALELCIEAPLEVLSSEEKISQAERLLGEVAGLLGEGKIELGELERRKRLESIKSLAGRLRAFKEDIDRLRVQLVDVPEHPVVRQASELERSIARHQSELDDIGASVEEFGRKIEQGKREIWEKKASLEKNAAKTLGTKVELVFREGEGFAA